jgi:hypothetical protein
MLSLRSKSGHDEIVSASEIQMRAIAHASSLDAQVSRISTSFVQWLPLYVCGGKVLSQTQTQSGGISPAIPLFLFSSRYYEHSRGPFSTETILGPHEIRNRGHRFCESFQLTNVTFRDFARVKSMSCKECSVEEHIATWLRSSRP